MVSVDLPMELQPYVGEELGTSAWRLVTEQDIASFAALSGDRHWVHTDRERARRETPFGDILAHGLLTLAFLVPMSTECLEVRRAKRWFNYGFDRVRFTHPVVPGDRLRLRVKLSEVEPVDAGATRIKVACTMEIDGKPKPALVADFVMIAFV